ncbi:MAG: Crp/Fnr family transcriptional regulator [Flavobacteriales bacterium]|nr:Crp/Fnr family transcriptional regulator [Flavobacteriales bacterium]
MFKKKLKEYIDRYVLLDESDFEHFYDSLSIQKFKKKEYLLEKGKICRNYFFIAEGLVRTYDYNEKGIEKIVQFGIDNWWFTNTDSFINQTKSRLNIQAIEETTVLKISKETLDLIYKEIPKIETLFRIITEKTLIAQQRSSYFYMKEDSKTRYYHLVNKIPEFAQRVPQYMIASYLDITPEYLSELRKTSE